MLELQLQEVTFIQKSHNLRYTKPETRSTNGQNFPKNKFLLNFLSKISKYFSEFTAPLNSESEDQFFWGEQYLLYAYLLDNKRIEVLYGSNYHTKNKPES